MAIDASSDSAPEVGGLILEDRLETAWLETVLKYTGQSAESEKRISLARIDDPV